MKRTGLFLGLLLAVPAMAGTSPKAAEGAVPQISGQYVESRNADVYTGPCIASSEVNIVGQEAVLAWHVDRGSWGNVTLNGLSIVAVVRASSTIGDEYANPLPVRAKLIVDSNADAKQRAALINFVQEQAGALLSNIIAVEALPIQLVTGQAHGTLDLKAGDEVHLATRAIDDDDMFCHNESVYYPPLAANLTHAMPAISTESAYSGSELGINWRESGRRGSFVGTFAL
ncbi:MAG: DUF1326 domain-containing protein [Acidobacteriia bacterium]|nr:DUF1326 domain-containing protein [Terriglobia bacterium]